MLYVHVKALPMCSVVGLPKSLSKLRNSSGISEPPVMFIIRGDCSLLFMNARSLMSSAGISLISDTDLAN